MIVKGRNRKSPIETAWEELKSLVLQNTCLQGSRDRKSSDWSILKPSVRRKKEEGNPEGLEEEGGIKEERDKVEIYPWGGNRRRGDVTVKWEKRLS